MSGIPAGSLDKNTYDSVLQSLQTSQRIIIIIIIMDVAYFFWAKCSPCSFINISYSLCLDCQTKVEITRIKTRNLQQINNYSRSPCIK